MALIFWTTPILVGSMLGPVKAEGPPSRSGSPSVSTYAKAKIQKRFEVRSDSFVEKKDYINNQLSDVSLHDCDVEVSKLIKNCVLMIYEIQ